MKNSKSKSLLLGLCAALAATASFALKTPETATQDDAKPLHTAALAIPEAKPAEVQPAPVIEPETEKFTRIDHKIKSGENLATIFARLGLDKKTLHRIIHTNNTGKEFANIAAGKILQLKTTQTGELVQLIYEKNAIDTLIAMRHGDAFTVEKQSKEIQRQTTSAQAIIHSSLFLDGKVAGLSDKMIMHMADIFAWDIDFALDLRDGDQFTVLYEKKLVNGKEIDSGEILAAEFVNQGKTHKAVRYKDKKGNVSYYSPDGKSMKKAFLRTPVAFTHISSRFNLKRKHPVLNRIRAHKGVDYAARTGTPVKSTSNGKIIFRGRKGGYGRVVIIQHGKSYSTLYAHLSKFRKGQRVGNHVKQGQIIGYVGQSGLATGPHLHYEFRINGVHKNPLTVALPKSAPIDKRLLADFKKQTTPLLSQLDTIKTTLVASSD